jgi:serine/threonine protein kinase
MKRNGPHSDIYSFGIMMFEIVFEKAPYTQEEMSNQEEFKKSVRYVKRPNLESVNIDDEKLNILVELMKGCWNSDKNQRLMDEEIVEIYSNK